MSTEISYAILTLTPDAVIEASQYTKEEMERSSYSKNSIAEVLHGDNKVFLRKDLHLFPIGKDLESRYYDNKLDATHLKQVNTALIKLGEGAYGKVMRFGTQNIAFKRMNAFSPSYILEVCAITCINNVYRKLTGNANQLLPIISIERKKQDIDINMKYLPNKLTPQNIHRNIYDIAKTLYYAQFAGLPHYDIKIENVLVDSDNKAYVMDWGISRWLPIAVQTNRIQTIMCKAPEVLCNVGKFGFQTDVWSLGMLIIDVFYEERHASTSEREHAEFLFSFYDEMQSTFDMRNIEKLIHTGAEQKVFLSRLPQNIRDLVIRCTNARPDLRITITDILNQDMFEQFRHEDGIAVFSVPKLTYYSEWTRPITPSFEDRREILLDWIFEVANGYISEGAFRICILATNIILEYISKVQKISSIHLQCVGCAALVIAISVINISKIFSIETLATLTDGSCTAKNIMICIGCILEKLEYNIYRYDSLLYSRYSRPKVFSVLLYGSDVPKDEVHVWLSSDVSVEKLDTNYKRFQELVARLEKTNKNHHYIQLCKEKVYRRNVYSA